MKKYLLIYSLILLSLIMHAAAPTHRQWDELLKKHVTATGKVNYKGFIKDKTTFEAYLKQISSVHPNNEWTSEQRKAYWINVYNAYTVKQIIDHYPVKSIKDIGTSSQSPWEINFIKIAGKSYTLNDIEHKILRKKFNDPRIHFAVNCAAVSCPKLLNQAYMPGKLEKQLEKNTTYFINNQSKNILGKDKIIISKIFEWYTEDFTKNGTIIDFLNQYSSTKINANAEISYKNYDWALNG